MLFHSNQNSLHDKSGNQKKLILNLLYVIEIKCLFGKGEHLAPTEATASAASGSGSRQTEAPGPAAESSTQPAEAPSASVFQGQSDRHGVV